MTFGLLFWFLMILWLLGFFWNTQNPHPYWPMGGNALLFILLALLGWKVFGPALH